MKRGPLRVDIIDEATLIELKYYYIYCISLNYAVRDWVMQSEEVLGGRVFSFGLTQTAICSSTLGRAGAGEETLSG